MASMTKNHQTEEVLRRMVSHAFSGEEAVRIKELTEGFYNVAYLAELSGGREVILKIAPPGNASVMTYEKNLMEAEVGSLRLVREKTQVPVPEVLYYSAEDVSDKLIESPYFFMTKIEGDNYNSLRESLTQEERDQINRELGKYNRQMNEITGQAFGYFSFAGELGNSWREVFWGMTKGVLLDGKVKNIDIGYEYDWIEDRIKDSLEVLEEVKIPQFVHWDLWDGNVFIKDGHIEGIIDFERTLWADPLMEYAFRLHNKLEGKQEEFLRGYGEALEGKDAYKRCVLYDIYLYLIMIIECDYRKYADNGQYLWAKDMLAKSVERLSELK